MKVAEHVQAVAFSPDDKRLMTGGRDKPMIGEFLQVIFGDSKFNPGYLHGFGILNLATYFKLL